MKFDMGSATLSTLTTDTRSTHQDLSALVAELVRATEPLHGSFNGAGRVAFDRFKASVDEVASDLNRSLAAILEGQAGLDHAFRDGDLQSGDNAAHAQAQGDFAAARFAARG
ncbi:MAG TPA: hypothetical protein VJ976_08345 [Ornithinimicrobium sp.]|uniref:hypothetical protein n=1 Tax=Ornithinimicrobium sp. TaxID=1977084 RepID=UPI002B48D7E1|nr:hypothetical protein [Ornithinimicrobium sp.]HKJ12382.1 hypothetical protein [Ornithinimicrobium sp.]